MIFDQSLQPSRQRNGVLPLTAGSAGPGKATKFIIRSVQGDYLTCREYADDGTQGDTDVLVAKHPEFRASVTSETIDAVEYTYDWTGFSDGTQRTSTDPDDNTETQRPTPRYLPYGSDTGLVTEPSCIIFAIEVENGTGVSVTVGEVTTPVTWIELTPRQWAKQ